ncbi:MAG: hypothetical protein IMY73_00625 [Bacteroidetes bacterium]|nr:hypothetical protein [Bacteroidota bacterium]
MRKIILGVASFLMMSMVFVGCDIDDGSDTRDEIVGIYTASIITNEIKTIVSTSEVKTSEKKYDGKIKIEKNESSFSNFGVNLKKWKSSSSSYSSYKTGSYISGKLTIDPLDDKGESSTTFNGVTVKESWNLKHSYTPASLDGSNLSINGTIIGTGSHNDEPYKYSATENWTLVKD